MRYLAEPFIVAALRRGQAVEQVLGPAGSPERPGIQYVEIRPERGTYEVYLHAALDCGPFTRDVQVLPPLFDSEEEDFGRLVAVTQDPLAALAAAETGTGAARERWVNHSMASDE